MIDDKQVSGMIHNNINNISYNPKASMKGMANDLGFAKRKLKRRRDSHLEKSMKTQ